MYVNNLSVGKSHIISVILKSKSNAPNKKALDCEESESESEEKVDYGDGILFIYYFYYS